MISIPAPAVCRRTRSSHTCILLRAERKWVYYIPMETLSVERSTHENFEVTWIQLPDLDVPLTATKYLAAGKYREIQDKARQELEVLSGQSSEAIADLIDRNKAVPTFQPQEFTMATSKPKKSAAKKSAAKKPAAKKPAAKKPAASTQSRKSASAKSTKPVAAGTRERTDTSKKINILVEGNPKREGTDSYNRFAVYKNGMTVAEAKEAGARSTDIKYDVAHGYIELE